MYVKYEMYYKYNVNYHEQKNLINLCWVEQSPTMLSTTDLGKFKNPIFNSVFLDICNLRFFSSKSWAYAGRFE